MRDAAAAATGKSMCTFNYRFMPAVRLAKDLIAAGRIGTIYHIRIHYLQMAGHDPSLPPDKVWYSAWPHSGGLQGIGSHAIDQCRFLVGEIASVSALVRTFNKDRADSQRRLPAGGHLRRRHGGRARFRERRDRRAGILGGGHGPEELSRLGDQRLARLAPLGPGASQQPVCLPRRNRRRRLLAGLHGNLRDGELPPLRRRVVAAGTQHRLGALPDHREVPLPRRGGQRQAAESLQRHVRGRLPRGGDHRRHAAIEPNGATSADSVRDDEFPYSSSAEQWSAATAPGATQSLSDVSPSMHETLARRQLSLPDCSTGRWPDRLLNCPVRSAASSRFAIARRPWPTRRRGRIRR